MLCCQDVTAAVSMGISGAAKTGAISSQRHKVIRRGFVGNSH